MPSVDQGARIANFIVHPVSILSTIFRLYDRGRRQRLGWDDAWAAFSLASTIAFMTLIEVLLVEPEDRPVHYKIGIDYAATSLFYTVVWSARLSILFTVIRISLPGKFQTFLYVMAFLFASCWAIVFAETFFICGKETALQTGQVDQCHLGTKVGVTQLVTDILSDALLVISPCYLIAKVKMTTTQKLRLISVFSASSITSIVSINHAIWLLVKGGIPEVLAAVVETAVSLIVANLSVLVGASFRSRGPSVSNTSASASASVGIRGLTTFLRMTNFRSDESNIDPQHEMLTINVTTDTVIANDAPPHPADKKYIKFGVREGGEREESQVVSSKFDEEQGGPDYHEHDLGAV